jgi:hypothetical protein
LTIVAFAAIVAVGFATSSGAAAHHNQAHTRFVPEVQAAERAASVTAYTNAVTLNEAEAWDAAVAANWGQALQALADNYHPAPPPAPASCNAPNCPHKAPPPRPSGPSSTGACGGATNGADAFIGRESGGNPSAQNPSGAYGCYQIMPGTWSGSCSDLGPEMGSSTSAQAQCASRLPRSSWSASGPT